MERRLPFVIAFAAVSVPLAHPAAAQQPSWRTTLTGRHDFLGGDVAWLQDLDGDGVRDYAASRTGVSTSPRPAAVALISGGSGALLREWVAPEIGDSFGAALETVADIDGDGLDDLAVSSPSRGGFAQPDPTLEIYSAASGALLRTHRASATPGVGWLVARLKDVNGDGVDDYLSSQWSGLLHVVLLSGATGAALRTHPTPTPNTLFGYCLADVGDLDGDGVNDYGIGDPIDYTAPITGVVYVHSGATGSLIRTLENAGTAGGIGGYSVAPTGDLDGDGVGDLLMGGVAGASRTDGLLMAISSGTGVTLWSALGAPAANEPWGTAVALADDLDGDGDRDVVSSSILQPTLFTFDAATGARGPTIALDAPCVLGLDASVDFDGDGLRELLVGTGGAAAPQQLVGAGVVTLFSGATRAALRTVHGEAWGSTLGAASVVIEDRDGDGYREIAIGAPSGIGDTRGVVVIASGRDGSERLRVHSSQAGDSFGAALAAVGDQDGDGIEELLVGAPASAGTGRAELISGATGAVLRTFTAPAGSARFGTAVAAAADATGAWRIAIADPQRVVGGSALGYVELHHLGSGSLLAAIDGSGGASSEFGRALAAPTDANGDGVPDFAIGAAFDNGTTNGSVELVSGVDGTRLWRIVGAQNGALLGYSVAAIGDLDGDGVDDLLTGSPNHSFSQNGSFVSARSGTTGKRLYRIVGSSIDGFGATLTQLGDVDQDGFDDFAVGSPAWSGTVESQGAVDVYSGSAGQFLKRFFGTGGKYSSVGRALLQPGSAGKTAVRPGRYAELGIGAYVSDRSLEESSFTLYALGGAFLTIDPPAALPNATVTATVRGGPSGALAGHYVVDFAGAPVDQFLAFGLLDAQSSFAISDTVPPGLSGTSATLRGYVLGWRGKVEVSSDEVLSFE